MRCIIALTLLAYLLTAPAMAEVRIYASPGGEVTSFLALFERVRASGENVVIDGPCLSACTLVLSAVPSDRICVTRRAVLGFHAAWTPGRKGRTLTHAEATNLMMETYPMPVRDWIARHGGLTRRLILLRGAELGRLYASCP